MIMNINKLFKKFCWEDEQSNMRAAGREMRSRQDFTMGYIKACLHANGNISIGRAKLMK